MLLCNLLDHYYGRHEVLLTSCNDQTHPRTKSNILFAKNLSACLQTLFLLH